MRPFDVVVVGAAGLDTCVYLGDQLIDPSRDASFTENRDGVGQAGGYASRGYAALGYRTAYFGALGDDAAGRAVREVLAAEGIMAEYFLDPAGTARSVNLMLADGRRVGFYDGRGNPSLQPDLAAVAALLAGCRLCHLNIPNWARQVIPLARAAGATVLTDLQDVRSADDPYRADFVDGSDIVCFSTVDVGDPEPVMEALWRRNPSLVQVAGMGSMGCAVGVGGLVRRFPVPPSALPVVDTNGAGDALAVGFASAFVLDAAGMAVADTDTLVATAVERGQRAARATCAQRVPKQRLASRADVGAGERPGAAQTA